FVKMVVAGEGLEPDPETYNNCFQDVADDWYAKYVCYAQEQEWVEGYLDGNFYPAANITKTEALAVIERVLDWEIPETVSWGNYSDVSPDDWFAPYVEVAENAGLLPDAGFWLSPHEIITRGQMSEYLYRALATEDGEIFEKDTYDEDLTYEEVLATGILPAIPPEYDFPAASQTGYPYACYGFAVKNLMEYRFGDFIEIEDLKTSIGWDGEWLWESDEFDNFAASYKADVVFSYNASPDFFLKKLARGVPLVVAVPYFIGDENVWHDVVAYSFDEEGVWTSDSDGGVTARIGFDEVFYEGQNFTRNVTEIRRVKAGGERKLQVFGF
ncbi:MAG: S-layer homology domain-containing protein, partial [Patescibacteria group bacterium]